MASWRIKEMSEKSGVSERMLRHFDKIDLLKPSRQMSNLYRSYSEQDLVTLQKIIALKTFCFSLKEIKAMLEKNQPILAHLLAQKEILRLKAESLNEVYSSLCEVIGQITSKESPKPHDLFTLIRRYQMTKNLRDTITGKALSEDQFQAYVTIYEKNPEDFAAWDTMLEKINRKEYGDPEGPDGEAVIEFQRKLIEKTKDTITEQRHLGADVLKSMKEGRFASDKWTPEVSHWLACAGMSYWLKRWNKLYDEIVANLSSDPKGTAGKKIASDWRRLIAQHLCVPPIDLAIGVMLWQELARQDAELKEQKTMPTPEELAKKIHTKLLFNPDALCWIEKALLAHPKH